MVSNLIISNKRSGIRKYRTPQIVNLTSMAINFNHLSEYILEDETVLLMPLQEYDLEHLLDFAINEPDTWIYSYISAAGEEGMRNYVHSAMSARAQGKEYAFIVFDKRTKENVHSYSKATC